MARVLVTDTYLEDIGDAIRDKLEVETTWKPSEMASAIESIETYPEPTGTKSITANGTGIDVKDYASADVNVPNTYTVSDEGKVVIEGALVAQGSQSITENGTYDTTLKNEVVVSVSGGGGSAYPWLDATYNGTLVGYEPKVTHAESAGKPFAPSSTYIEQAVSSGFSGDIYDLATGKKVLGTSTFTISQAEAILPVSDFTDLWKVDVIAKEYAGYIYGTSKITDLGLVLLGDFSQGGASSGNVLDDSIDNYSGIVLQGIYNKNRTSGYNTTVMYQDVVLNQQYWAGMKDRNNSYRCLVTFTDNTHVDLGGGRQVIIYGIL